MKCTEKKGCLQKKLDKLRSFSFSIENQITLLKGHANMGKTSAYDDSPSNEGSAMKSKDSMDMTMNNDELREMIGEINKDLKYMQLKSSEKLWRRCRHVFNKPLVSMKNNLSKLFQGDRKPVTRSRKPGNGAFRLNVNGFKSDGGLIGVGGVIRGSVGNWINGFMINIGADEVLQAEAWGISYGLQLAVSSQIKNIVVESESAVLIRTLQRNDFELHYLGNLFKYCRHLMSYFDDCQLRHIHTESNTVADLLAKESINRSNGLWTIYRPPALVTEALLDDSIYEN